MRNMALSNEQILFIVALVAALILPLWMRHKDKLMKKGEQLTKSLRTEEEKLKDGEEELKKMLQEGAIDLETYSRGMEKLHEKSKKEFKVKFKVSGVDAVIAGSADAAARLEEFRASQKKGGGEEKVDFKKQGRA